MRYFLLGFVSYAHRLIFSASLVLVPSSHAVQLQEVAPFVDLVVARIVHFLPANQYINLTGASGQADSSNLLIVSSTLRIKHAASIAA